MQQIVILGGGAAGMAAALAAAQAAGGAARITLLDRNPRCGKKLPMQIITIGTDGEICR